MLSPEHEAKEREEVSAERDNNQHDDVIFRLNAPLGREEGIARIKGGRGGRFSTLVIRVMSLSRDDYYDGVSTACKSHRF